MSTAPDINNAVIAAKAAYEKWKRYTVKERVKFILKLRQIIEENEDELAELIMLEHGKNRVEGIVVLSPVGDIPHLYPKIGSFDSFGVNPKRKRNSTICYVAFSKSIAVCP